MTFSLPGLLVSLAILAPSFVLLPFPPRGGPEVPPRVGLPLTVLERAGQAGCLVAPAMTGSSMVGSGGRVGWLVLVVVSVAIYYGLWVRYFRRGRSFAALYAPLRLRPGVGSGGGVAWSVPVPMAVFPVLGFLAAAAWLGSWWAAAAALALAIGHIGSALRIARATIDVAPHARAGTRETGP